MSMNQWEKKECNGKMYKRHEHGFHFTKEETQMEKVRTTVCVHMCAWVRMLHACAMLLTELQKKKKCNILLPH